MATNVKKLTANHPNLLTLPSARFVACTGEAHGNAYIDNCHACAPRWGTYPVCPSCTRYDDNLDEDNGGPMPLEEWSPTRRFGGRSYYPRDPVTGKHGPLWGRCPKCATEYRTGVGRLTTENNPATSKEI